MICSECGQDKPRVLEGVDWCDGCISVEGQRNAAQDGTGRFTNLLGRQVEGRTRPPKFMLDPSEYKKYGY